jgi:hypothetical protein
MEDNQFTICIRSFMGIDEWVFTVDHTYTILKLKYELSSHLDAFEEEISLIVNSEYPYPLCNDLYLYSLREEHRTLHAIVNETPTKVIPRRLLKDNLKTLDLRNMRDDDLQYIIRSNWIVSYNYQGVKKVIFSCTHALFDEILKKIAGALKLSLHIEERPQYPLHYYIDGFIGKDEEDYYRFFQTHFDAFHYFYNKLSSFKSFHRIKLYIGNTEDNSKLITREWINDFNPDLAEKMWAY